MVSLFTSLHRRTFACSPPLKYTDLTFNMLSGQTTFGQRRTNLILGVGWKFCPDLINTGGRIVSVHFLLKITDLQVSLLIRRHLTAQESVRGCFLEASFFRFHLHLPERFSRPLSMERVRGRERGSSYPITRSLVSKIVFARGTSPA